MNKDLDDRLIPNGEYRDAQNISVGKSESDDIGSLENILGNIRIPVTDLAAAPILAANMKIIGQVVDENNGIVYVFATNYTDVNGPSYASQPIYANGAAARCIIYSWNLNSPTVINRIVDDIFLNFSTTNPIQGSLIEDLLFFTDNRNQPRKINITKILGYYKNESQISVAKYSPYQSISLVKKAESVVVSSSNVDNFTDTVSATRAANTQILGGTLGPTPASRFATYGADTIKCTLNGTTVATDGVTDALLNSLSTQAGGGGTPAKQQYNFTINTSTTIGDVLTFIVPGGANSIVLTTVAGIEIGMSMVSTSSTGAVKITGSQYITVTAINVATKTITVSSNVTVATGDILNFLISTMSNKSADVTWPGDPDYLEDRYVRFSYRFQYDDGEYSIMAPFTQIAYVPKQKGYFFGSGITAPATVATPTDENAAYRSTVVEFMENEINNIGLLIPLPEVFADTNITSEYKIKNVEILYKESDALIVKVLDTLTVRQVFNTSVNNICTYDYQSRKPYKSLTEEQTVRVYDKVPVRSLAQETAGSRIIYGNYTDRYTPPNDVDYEVKVVDKNSNIFDNWIEYPNHTLKQNRNYQVGFVLADKYGRQSPVVLSPVDIQKSAGYSGSTIFAPYNSSLTNIKSWFGDALQLTVTSRIEGGTVGLTDQPNFQTGTPGLYAVRTGNGDGFNVTGATATVTSSIYTFTPTANSIANVPVLNNYLRGEFTDFVKVTNVTLPVAPATQYSITCDGAINKDYEKTELTGADLKYAYTLNKTGWYSYKVVVKQNEQDYYNVYLPGILNGYPNQILTVPGSDIPPLTLPTAFPSNEDGKTANIVLLNDNINKVPRDLSEVGPEQKQFRSSVQLFGRVENNIFSSTGVRNNAPTPLSSINLSITTAPTRDVKVGDIVTGVGITAGTATVINTIVSQTSFTLSQNASIPNGTALTFTEALDAINGGAAISSNKQFFPGITTATAINISTADDSNMEPNDLAENSGRKNLYQIDTNPLIARLSTPSAIGVVSGTNANAFMLPYLAIYETEPVDSLLDIFWETATEGLIADLNSDIDNGFEGATAFTETAYTQTESAITNSSVTQPFYAINQEGTVFKTTGIFSFIGDSLPATGLVPRTSASGAINWSVSSTKTNLNSLQNIDGSEKFILQYNNTVGSDERYSYTIKLNLPTAADRFIYKLGSSSEVYTFILNIKTTTDSGTTISEPASLTTLGSLTNITPNLLTPLPQVFKDITEGTSAADPILDYSALAVTPGVNGTSNSVKTDDLFYEITSQINANNNNVTFFTLTQNGKLFQTSAIYGVYTIEFTLRDARTGANTDTGSIPITRSQVVTMGPESLNSGVASDCLFDLTPVGNTTQPTQTGTLPKNQFTSPNDTDPAYYNSPTTGIDKSVSGVWYISTNTYTGYGVGAGEINAGLAANQQIPGLLSSFPLAKENGTKPWKLGTALTGGTVAFSCNISQDNTHSSSPNGYLSLLQSTAQFRVFYRSVIGTGAWVRIKDINNNSYGDISNASLGLVPADRGSGPSTYVISTGNLNINNQPFTSYAQIIFAFDKVGEYAIMFDEGSTITGDEPANRMVAWCNSSDLYYSTCVIEGGVKINSGAIQSYQYGIANNPGTVNPSCLFGTNSIFSPVPYGEYVPQFFTTGTYAAAFTFNTGGTSSNETNYYAFKGNTVYLDPSSASSNFFTFSSKFTTATGKKFPTTGGTECYAKYCNTSCDPVIRKFPYALNS